MREPDALKSCRRCGWAKNLHPSKHGACSEFAELRPYAHLPDYEPAADQERPGWSFYDPETDNVLLVIPEETWTYAFRLVYRGGTFPVAEVRIYPTEPPMEEYALPGEWSHDPVHVPKGGLTAEGVRRTPLGKLRENIGVVLKELQDKLGGTEFGQQLRSRELPDDLLRRIRRPPRRKLSAQEEQLRVAAVYAAAIQASTPKPRTQVAKWLGLTPERVGNILHEARRNGYLTEAKHGKAGGELTETAINLLRQGSRQQEQDP